MLAILAAVSLTVPLSFGLAYGYELNPAYLLAPLIAWVFFTDRYTALNTAFLCAALAGLASIVVANMIDPGHFVDNTANLVIEVLFAPSFLFLGREISGRIGLSKLVTTLAIPSAIFLIVCAVPLLLSGTPVRATNPDGTVFLDIHFLGLPVYAVFGINSLAPLFCIQVAIIAGAVYRSNRYLLALFAAGIVCGVFLAIGSQSRAAMFAILLVIPFVAIYVASHLKLPLAPSAIVVASFLAAGTMAIGGQGNGRLAGSFQALAHGSELPAGAKADGNEVDTLTTGRSAIWHMALDEFRASPVIGNGFSGFGRFDKSEDQLPESLRANTTAHLYYLNVLWKGGVLFALPFLVFTLLAFRAVWRGRQRPASSPWIFSLCGVVMMFTFPSLTWDILIIPSAGALAWFLLGALGDPPTIFGGSRVTKVRGVHAAGQPGDIPVSR